MIFQGIFNILDLYSNEIDDFYNNIDKYFHQKIDNLCEKKTFKECSLKKEFKEMQSFLTKELIELGFEREEIEYNFSDESLKIRKDEIGTLKTPIERYEKKFAPIIYEIFLEKIVDYLAEFNNTESMMLNLKSKGFLPIELIMEIRNLKNLFKKFPEKLENLRKYIRVRENIIHKFSENKIKIEHLEDLENLQEKLQLIYLFYKIIDFFHISRFFDFSHIKTYLKNNLNEWLVSIPLITLKNPDLYFCGIYLLNHLLYRDEDIQKIEKIKKFLMDLYEDNIDEFEAPIIEATDRLYYYIKSTKTAKLWLSEEQINKLANFDLTTGQVKFFERSFLKNLETSQLVVILKIYHLLGIYKKIEDQKIKAIIEEIEQRITPEGARQYRDGFVISESTYYVLYLNYLQNTLDKLKDQDLIASVVSRIYRNLEILDFSEETNNDLVSDLFYSCECLKLLNCIETKEMIIHLAKYLFPDEIIEKILKSEDIRRDQTTARFRHLKVNRITGETIY